MASKRGNPVESPTSRSVLSQQVANPVGSMQNTDKGNPAKLRVPAAKGSVISQKVGNPVGKRQHTTSKPQDKGNPS